MLRRSSYTVDGVVSRIGAPAVSALGRNNPVPARVALADDRDPLAILVRLLLIGDPVDIDEVQRVLPVDRCGGLLQVEGAVVTAPAEIAPHGDEVRDWWVVSDRVDSRGRPRRRDHVLGVGGASTTLAQLTVRRPVMRALDIGTGCGVQALHLAQHSADVTATDVVPRALQLAATTFALSGVDVELAAGDLTEAVPGREFDLVVCNPPFVVGPRPRFDYRDAGRDADDMSRAAVRAVAGALADGGVAQLLVNWLHVEGEDWRDRVAEWVTDLGCDAWLIERDVQEPVGYVETWLADAGEADAGLAADWLRWLRDRRVDAVGFGWVVLRRAAPPHRVVVEPVVHQVDQPLGVHIAEWLDAVAWLRGRSDDDLLGAAFRAAPSLRRDVVEQAGDAGWSPLATALRLDEGFRWTLPADEPTAALVAGCDGATALRTVLAVLAAVTGVEEDDLRAPACATVRGLVGRGLLLPA